MSCLDKWHILEIEDLSIVFTQYEKGTRQRHLETIRNLSVSVHEGEIVAIVGASGSGKSLLAHDILGVLPKNAKSEGNMFFQQEPLTPQRKIECRGKEIALIPQSTNYLDPLMKVGKQVLGGRKDKESKEKAKALLKRYELPEEIWGMYPHQCSGGMLRRILVCTALMGNPKLIVADEPTPGLDPDLARQALQDLRQFADQKQGVLLITHDIELALEVADRIAIFYGGTTVEEALVSDFQEEALLRHPYTKALYRALPSQGFEGLKPGEQNQIDFGNGCVFGVYCEKASEECREEIPMKIVRCGRVRCAKCEGEIS